MFDDCGQSVTRLSKPVMRFRLYKANWTHLHHATAEVRCVDDPRWPRSMLSARPVSNWLDSVPSPICSIHVFRGRPGALSMRQWTLGWWPDYDSVRMTWFRTWWLSWRGDVFHYHTSLTMWQNSVFRLLQMISSMLCKTSNCCGSNVCTFFTWSRHFTPSISHWISCEMTAACACRLQEESVL